MRRRRASTVQAVAELRTVTQSDLARQGVCNVHFDDRVVRTAIVTFIDAIPLLAGLSSCDQQKRSPRARGAAVGSIQAALYKTRGRMMRLRKKRRLLALSP